MQLFCATMQYFKSHNISLWARTQAIGDSRSVVLIFHIFPAGLQRCSGQHMLLLLMRLLLLLMQMQMLILMLLLLLLVVNVNASFHTHTHTHKFFFVASLLSPSLHPSPILLPISESLKCPCCLPSSPNPPPSLLFPPGRGYACHLRHGQLASSVFGLLATAT